LPWFVSGVWPRIHSCWYFKNSKVYSV